MFIVSFVAYHVFKIYTLKPLFGVTFELGLKETQKLF